MGSYSEAKKSRAASLVVTEEDDRKLFCVTTSAVLYCKRERLAGTTNTADS
jgi:hypothetical protein